MQLSPLALAAAAAAALVVATSGAPARAEPVSPSDGVLRAGDLSGPRARTVSPKGWRKLLRTRAKAGSRAFVGTGAPRLLLVSRALVASTGRQAGRLARVVRRVPRKSANRLDAAALRMPASALRGVTRLTWRERTAVGQVVLVDPDGAFGASFARSLVSLLRQRVREVASRTVWDSLVARVAVRRGKVDKRTALQAFAVAFGRVPGARVPAGPKGVAHGTLALSWVFRNFNRLSAAQRKAIGRTVARLTRGARGARITSQDEQWKRDALEHFRAKLGITRPSPAIELLESDVGGNRLAVTVPKDAAGEPNTPQPPVRCEIEMRTGTQALSPADRRGTIGHEVFHCLQAQILGNDRLWWTMPGWRMEGTAAWAECNFEPRSDLAASRYKTWFGTPETELFSREYDAMGFFTLLGAAATDPFGRMPAILQATYGEDAYDAAVAGVDQPLNDAWAASLFGDPGRGASWDLPGPCKPEVDAPNLPAVQVSNGGGATQTAAARAANRSTLVSTADITHVSTSSGNLRISGGDGDDLDVTDSYYCTKAGGCACPAGTHYEGPLLRNLPPSPRPYLALTGTPSGGRVTYAGERLDPHCKPGEPPVTPLPRCPTLETHQVCLIFDGTASGEETTYASGAAFDHSGTGSQSLHMVWLLTWPTWAGVDDELRAYSTGSGQGDIVWGASFWGANKPDDCHMPLQLQPLENEGRLLDPNGPASPVNFHVLVPFYRNVLDAICPDRGSFYYAKAFTFLGFTGPGETIDFTFPLTPNTETRQDYDFTRPFPAGPFGNTGSSHWSGTMTAVVGPGSYE